MLNNRQPKNVTSVISPSRGFTLIELMVFIVVISIGLVGLTAVYNYSMAKSVDPVIQVRLHELAQSLLDEILARKYDENTPTGGIPACGAPGGAVCAGIGLDGENLADIGSLDDVDDFDGYSDSPYAGYTRSVSITAAGADLGLTAAEAKLVQVTVSAPGGERIQLSAYRANF